jgi:hypothetical protein
LTKTLNATPKGKRIEIRRKLLEQQIINGGSNFVSKKIKQLKEKISKFRGLIKQ